MTPLFPPLTVAIPAVNVINVAVPNVMAAPLLLVTVGAVTGDVEELAPENVSVFGPVYAGSTFPTASRAVIVRPCAVPAVCEPVPVITRRVAAPAVNATVAVWVIATELSVPLTVAVPALAADVSVAEYVPLALFVVAPIDPRLVDRTTVPPLPARLFPLASFACAVMADVLEPLACIDVGDATIVDVTGEAAPGFTVTDADVPAWAVEEVAVNVPEPDVPV